MVNLTDRMRALARRGDLEAVRRLLDRDPALVGYPRGAHNRSLLWEAARHGRDTLVDLLIDRGAPISGPGRNRAECLVLLSPLAIARLYKRDGIVGKLTRKGAHLSLYDHAYFGDLEAVERAIDEDPTVVNTPLPEDVIWQTTPLHFAAAGNQYAAACLLCDRGAQVRPHGPLLLEFAARRGSRALLELFLDRGARARDLTAFAVLVGGHSAELLPFLAAKGLDVNGDNFGYPALIYGSRGDKGEHPDWIEDLLANGADVRIRDRKGQTALHVAATAGFCTIARQLIDAGADVNARCNANRTPLDCARARKRHDTVALLESAGGAE